MTLYTFSFVMFYYGSESWGKNSEDIETFVHMKTEIEGNGKNDTCLSFPLVSIHFILPILL